MEKVVLGLSGGVDSAVCAKLLKAQGYEVLGLYLDIGTNEARQDAIATAKYLNIPLEIADISRELEEKVCAPFAQSYLRGETPNPCILCNPAVKFRYLLEYADRMSAEKIATGHYAKAENGMLFKGMPNNDQSYMLCRLTRAQVKRLVLPLGAYEKRQVRELANEYGIPVANKPDSMEICFIPDKDYVAWLRGRGAVPEGGEMVFHGETIARHEGIYRYTVGQRIAGLWNERKLYVAEIKPDTNQIVLALWEELFKTEVNVRDMNWLIDVDDKPINANVRVRHTKWENPACTVTPYKNGGALIICDTPVRAPAKGQSAVLYDGERVLGGGFIC